MPAQIIGATSQTVAEVNPSRRSLRAAIEPNEVVGSYRVAQTSGTIAAGLSAASLIFGFRWAPSGTPTLAAIKHVRISIGDLVGFTAGFVAFNLFPARSYTVLDTTGGTSATLTGNNAKLRTAFPTTAGASCAISTTAAISGGTSTLDTMPIATVSGSVIATAGQPPIVNGFDLWGPLPGEMPLILANNEGFVIKATVPATGTWQAGVEVQWDELASF